MKKGKVKKVCGVKVYKRFEKKTLEERGKQQRNTVFKSKKDYDRNKEKSRLKNILSTDS